MIDNNYATYYIQEKSVCDCSPGTIATVTASSSRISSAWSGLLIALAAIPVSLLLVSVFLAGVSTEKVNSARYQAIAEDAQAQLQQKKAAIDAFCNSNKSK